MPTQEEDLLRRITELESMYMHLQQDYEALNETVLRNATAVEKMSRQIAQLISKIPANPDGGEVRSLEEEKPPHY